jgi:hypothetical protein
MAFLSIDLIRWRPHTPAMPSVGPEGGMVQGTSGERNEDRQLCQRVEHGGPEGDDSILVTQAAELQLFGDRGTFFEAGRERVCFGVAPSRSSELARGPS